MRRSQLNMLEHSEAKIKLLSLYMDRYLNILNQSKYVSDIFIYDMFCGEGIYKDGGKGSPIIFLEKIKNIHFRNKARDTKVGNFHCRFNDIDEKKIKKLHKIIEDQNLHYPEIGTLEISCMDYSVMLKKTIKELRKLKNDKAFAFIDPYGYKNVKAGDIKKLLETGKSEVLLFLPTQNMFRFEKKATPESLQKFISELVPPEDWPESETGLHFIETLVDEFRNYLGQSYFVDSFVLSRGRNQFFCLFFFTSHIRGFEKMLEAKWKIDEEEGRGWKKGMDRDLFSLHGKTAKTDKLRSSLKKYLMQSRSNGQLYEFGLNQGFRPTHVTSILKELQKNGLIDVHLEDGTDARKGSFYISYKHFKNNPEKIEVIKRR